MSDFIPKLGQIVLYKRQSDGRVFGAVVDTNPARLPFDTDGKLSVRLKGFGASNPVYLEPPYGEMYVFCSALQPAPTLFLNGEWRIDRHILADTEKADIAISYTRNSWHFHLLDSGYGADSVSFEEAKIDALTALVDVLKQSQELVRTKLEAAAHALYGAP